jgi:hypothetical protein
MYHDEKIISFLFALLSWTTAIRHAVGRRRYINSKWRFCVGAAQAETQAAHMASATKWKRSKRAAKEEWASRHEHTLRHDAILADIWRKSCLDGTFAFCGIIENKNTSKARAPQWEWLSVPIWGLFALYFCWGWLAGPFGLHLYYKLAPLFNCHTTVLGPQASV